MSNWELELEALFRRLGVQWDGPLSDEAEADPYETDPAGLAALAEEDQVGDGWGHAEEDDLDQLEVVRRQMQATVGRVARMVKDGHLDSAIRDDVLFVLRALVQSQPPREEGETEEEAQLATAAAILHFCRIVLRLTHALAQQ
jgi:hypothetical protein